jgi:hypothetical protein
MGYSPKNYPFSFQNKNKKHKIIIARRLIFWQKQAGRISNVEKIKL